MRHLWVVEEKGRSRGWALLEEESVFTTKKQALNVVRHERKHAAMWDIPSEFRVTKYVPEKK